LTEVGTVTNTRKKHGAIFKAKVAMAVRRHPRAREAREGFIEMAQSLRTGYSGWPAEMGQARLWYEQYLESIH
jgi:hypothetical protein